MNIVDTIYTLKLEFGQMKGTELIIKYGNCILTAAKELSYSCIYDAKNSITLVNIPSDTESFTLKLVCENLTADNNTEELYDTIIMNAEMIYDGKHIRENIIYHRIMFPEYAAFLVKPAHESWNSLKNDMHNSNEMPYTKSKEGNINRFFNKKYLIKLFPVGLFVVLIILTAYFTMNDRSDKTVSELSEILYGATEPIYIYHDNNYSKSVILVTKNNIADWVKQRLVNVNYNKKTSVYLVNNFENEINKKFRMLDIPILKVDLNTYELITVRLLSTNNNIKNTEVVKNFISKEVPYIKNVKILFYDGNSLMKKAIKGIQKSGVKYYSITYPENNNIIIKADLNDEQLYEISSFIDSFKKIWGDNYIEFSVLLATDYLSGKSFMTGKDGYILLNNNHWYFKSE